jgi:glycogen debranching enzyme
VRSLKPNALAALDWIDARGEYVTYERRNTESGLENQCWKDSADSIRFADGRVARGPITTCEIQGYAYDAKVRSARLAREVWREDELATRLEHEAAELRERFNRDFWLSERDFYAEALDGEGRRVDSITSNAGHLLWSGIVPEDRAKAVAARLMSDELFSGWGVRTMAEGEGGYNPIRYHNGTVWPHDNSLIALGLARYGFREEANRIATALIEAAAHFRYRLPEVFAGYRRTRTGFPVEYPTASSPQAWATGTPFVFLRTMLGLEPQGSRLRAEPVLPPEVSQLELRAIPFREDRVDVTSSREEALR